MKVENLKRQGNLVTFEVKDEYPQLEVEMDKKFRSLVKKVKVPGFRIGKSPKGHFVNWYGIDRLSYEALIDLINENYSAIISEHRIDVIDHPVDVQVLQLEQDKPFKVSISVEVKPEIKMSKYKGIKLEKDSVKVEKDDVSKAIQSELDSQATYEEDAKAPIEDEAQVIVDVFAKVDDRVSNEWTDENCSMTVGKAKISAEFDEQIKGLKQEDEKEFSITMSKKDKEGILVSNDPVHFRVKIKSVKIKRAPKLTDEWVRSKTDKKNVEEYRRSVETEIKTQREKSAEEKLKTDVANWVVENVENEIPDVMTRKEVDRMLQQMERNFKRLNIDLSTYLQITNKTLDMLRSEYRDDALKSVKYQLGLDAIAEAEAIKVSQEELDKELEESLKSEPDEAQKELYREQFRAQLGRSREVFEEPIKHRKVVDFLLEHAKIKRK